MPTIYFTHLSNMHMSGAIHYRKAKTLGTVPGPFGPETKWLIQYERSDGKRGEEIHTDTSLVQAVKNWSAQGVNVIEVN